MNWRRNRHFPAKVPGWVEQNELIRRFEVYPVFDCDVEPIALRTTDLYAEGVSSCSPALNAEGGLRWGDFDYDRCLPQRGFVHALRSADATPLA
jgi:hypothetical protein